MWIYEKWEGPCVVTIFEKKLILTVNNAAKSILSVIRAMAEINVMTKYYDHVTRIKKNTSIFFRVPVREMAISIKTLLTELDKKLVWNADDKVVPALTASSADTQASSEEAPPSVKRARTEGPPRS